MPVVDEHARLVGDRQPGSGDAIEDVQVAAAGKRRTGVERLVEPTQREYCLPPRTMLQPAPKLPAATG